MFLAQRFRFPSLNISHELSSWYAVGYTGRFRNCITGIGLPLNARPMPTKRSWHRMTSKWASWRINSSPIRLFSQLFVQANIKENIKHRVTGPFVRGMHRWPMDSPHKWSVTWKALPFHDAIMNINNQAHESTTKCDSNRKWPQEN